MRSILLTGAVGAGKTTVAAALSDVLAERGVVHAVVDTDEIRRLRPPPAGDPFQLEVQLTNLASVAVNFRTAGATGRAPREIAELIAAAELRRATEAGGVGRP